uniref:NADH-ubiquinone oxidoreductase chain 3 n=1 Tax=Didesmococcus koreanus TaxID=1661411 RepID=A0A891GZN1_9HEMI|nr:NADH dehydrogenase subunit 3 [Didesmococcus koreanus]QRK27455.1 NADH dehydrogenase subunit 3 [Didesmococcus koreanus]
MKIIKFLTFLALILIFTGMKLKKISVFLAMNYPVECGFNSMMNKKKSLNMKFISIMLIFVMFDLEISIITPMIFSIKKNTKVNMVMMTLMMTFMNMSMIYEMKMKSIKWI